jgi:heparin binding hemagglutinin HbhA
MAAENNAKIPTPLYAAAAVGDLAYQRLRKLPTAVAELRGKVAAGDLDADRLRGIAQRNAALLQGRAQAAQERAQAIYAQLVAHGEQVVRGRRVVQATVGAEAQPEPATPAAPKAVAKKASPAADQPAE